VIPGNYFVRRRADRAADPRWRDSTFAAEPPGVREALGYMRGPGVTETAMTEIVRAVDGAEAIPRLFYWLTRLEHAAQLEYILRLSDGTDARLVPQRPGRVFRNARFDAAAPYVVSRHAFVRREGDEMQIESALRGGVIRFRSWIPAALMTMFAQPASCDSMAGALPGKAAFDARPVAELLVLSGFLEDAAAPPPSPAWALWEFHELLFHERSSMPRMGEPFAAVHPHRQPEPPLLRPEFRETEPVALPPPRLADWIREDPPLARLMEDRRSARAPGPDRPTLTDVGDFLYRTAHFQTDSLRALPSAGARHELEFYAAVDDAEGLVPGFYHYHAPSHRLHRLRAAEEVVGEFMSRAALAWSTGRQHPHLVITVAARFPRMASRYASIAYRNTMLDAGIAIEAMYLNATAMGMAPCALGINLPDLFARITGLDPFDETPVALFALSG
jgi:SagB-type dehydrogenase family enzyme